MRSKTRGGFLKVRLAETLPTKMGSREDFAKRFEDCSRVDQQEQSRDFMEVVHEPEKASS